MVFNLMETQPKKEEVTENWSCMLISSKLIAVKSFIKSLKADESHYCRGKSVRHYFSAELIISKLHKMYNQKSDADNQVKFSYFYHAFTTYFNVRCGSPKTDAFSTCIEFNEKIQAKDDADKNKRLQNQESDLYGAS